MTPKDIEFPSRDGLTLKGTLRMPDGPVTGVAVIIAGSGPTDRNGNTTAVIDPAFNNVNLYRDIAEYCADNGIAVLTYDKRSCAGYKDQWKTLLTGDLKQAGDFFDFDHMVDDAKLAISALVAEAGLSGLPLTVMGHSEGGLVALRIAKDQKVDNLVLLATAGRTMREILQEQIFTNVHRQTGNDGIAKAFLAATNNAMDAIVQDAPLPADLPPSLKPLFNEATRKHFKQVLDDDPVLLAANVEARVIVINGTHDMQIHHERDAEKLDAAFAKRDPSAAPHSLVKIEGASHCFKQAADPYDIRQSFAGTLAPELLPAITDFVNGPKKPGA